MKTRIYYMIYNTTEYSVAIFGKEKKSIFYDKKEAEKACKFANEKKPEGKYIIETKTEQYDDTKKILKTEEKDWGDFDKTVTKPYYDKN